MQRHSRSPAQIMAASSRVSTRLKVAPIVLGVHSGSDRALEANVRQANRRSISSFSRLWPIACLIVAIISGLIYLPAMNGQAIWEDRLLIQPPDGPDTLAKCFTL